MSDSKPFPRNGDQHGAVPAQGEAVRERVVLHIREDEPPSPVPAVQPQAPPSKWLCCCCGEPVAHDAVIDIVQDGSRLTGLTPRGRAMMTLTIDGALETTVAILDYADALRLVEEFGKRQLIVARPVEADL